LKNHCLKNIFWYYKNNMFDQLKQLLELKKMQNSLSQERATVEKEGIKVTVNGKMEAEEIQLNPDLPKETQEKILKDCLNEAVKKVQISVAKKISQSSGFGM